MSGKAGSVSPRQPRPHAPVPHSTAQSAVPLHQFPSLSPRRLAVNQITTYRWSLREDVLHFRQAGYRGIGLWRPKLVEFGEARSVDLLRNTPLTVSSLSWAGGFTGTAGQTFRDALEDARDALRLAGAVNAGCLVIAAGAQAGHIRSHARRLLVEALQALADPAAELGVQLAVQPMHPMFGSPWTFLSDLDETLEIIERCKRPEVGLAFDVYHLWQEPRLLERIREITPRTALVQLNDWQSPPRSELDRCLPGDGEIPLREITAAFADAGYTGWFEMNIWSEELWRSDYMRLLQTCRTRFDAMCGAVAARR